MAERTNLTENKLAECREAFALFDADGDGAITTTEVGTLLRSLGQTPTEAEVREMVSLIDTNGNGMIEFEEFVDLMLKTMDGETTERDFREAFSVFDRDENGFITADELRYILTQLGEALTDDEVDDIIREVDIDGDGQINYQEFIVMMTM
ncbi:neo-calmodulin-like [Teleopsis dalmanni]|uniref:neo-calmodulin-like n=1 Tax=Teleopsis dalmanni TaxID=139649 RepID=UPI0018CFAD36|nr:neo-calmodulin-like [Teleopsis dalmanni]